MTLRDIYQVKNIPNRGNSKGKGPGVKVQLAYLRNSEEENDRWGE